MRRKISALCLGFAAVSVATTADAGTVAYWRFEDGPADANVVHIAGADNTYSADVADVSGNGNHLSAWNTGGCCGYAYRTDKPGAVVPQTGAANNFAVSNTGGGPGMYTGASGIQSITPAAFTIEASFKLENGGYRTIIGRDSTGVVDSNGALAAVYLQAVPGNALAIKFADQDGFWHEAISPADTLTTFPYPNFSEGDWYHASAVSDGSTLSLYLANATDGTGYQLVAQTDLTLSGSTNTAMATPAGDGGDWDAGNWTVGRGMFNGGHGDRAYGFIDEVRFSDSALSPSQFLWAPEPTSLVMLATAAATALAARRR